MTNVFIAGNAVTRDFLNGWVSSFVVVNSTTEVWMTIKSFGGIE